MNANNTVQWRCLTLTAYVYKYEIWCTVYEYTHKLCVINIVYKSRINTFRLADILMYDR